MTEGAQAVDVVDELAPLLDADRVEIDIERHLQQHRFALDQREKLAPLRARRRQAAALS